MNLSQYFADYYRQNEHEGIIGHEEREFGYTVRKKQWVRYLSVNKTELNTILSTGPLDAYISHAYYDNPRNDAKIWKHGNLIFDIDSKDLKLDCLDEHKTMPCDKCMRGCVEEYKKLTEIFSKLGIISHTCYFSGNSGLHIECDPSEYNHILPDKRHKLVDYISNYVNIDRMVTLDKSRIFRLPDSINSKTGLLKTRCDNPYKDAIVLSHKNIQVRGAWERFRLNGRVWHENTGTTTIPIYVAVYLYCKGFIEETFI